MKFWKEVYLWKMSSINLAYGVPKLAKVWHIDFIENVVDKVNRNFWVARWRGIKFCRNPVVHESLLW